jgi:hypothetical protein
MVQHSALKRRNAVKKKEDERSVIRDQQLDVRGCTISEAEWMHPVFIRRNAFEVSPGPEYKRPARLNAPDEKKGEEEKAKNDGLLPSSHGPTDNGENSSFFGTWTKKVCKRAKSVKRKLTSMFEAAHPLYDIDPGQNSDKEDLISNRLINSSRTSHNIVPQPVQKPDPETQQKPTKAEYYQINDLNSECPPRVRDSSSNIQRKRPNRATLAPGIEIHKVAVIQNMETALRVARVKKVPQIIITFENDSKGLWYISGSALIRNYFYAATVETIRRCNLMD